MSLLAKSKQKGSPIFGLRLDRNLKQLLFTQAAAQGTNASHLAREILAAQLLSHEKP